MPGEKIKLTFYHSVVCPRCHYTGIVLRAVLRRRPDIDLARVEVLTHTHQARNDGVRAVPALVSGGRRLSGFVLTRTRIERFLDSLAKDSA